MTTEKLNEWLEIDILRLHREDFESHDQSVLIPILKDKLAELQRKGLSRPEIRVQLLNYYRDKWI